MATSYARLSGWWGSVELLKTDEQVYTAAQKKALGTNATSPGTAIRRAQLVFSRTPTGSTEDVATTHLDYLNLTAGEPDDTWVDADFATLEGYIDTWWTALKPYVWSKCSLTQIRWYRIGPGIAPPNPPVRITTRAVPGTNSTPMAPQVSVTLTLKTGVRKEWGRLYLPHPGGNIADTTNGRIDSSIMGTVATASDVLFKAAFAADFVPVVYGRARQKVYTVESLQIDDLFDVQRRRRWDRPLTRVVKS